MRKENLLKIITLNELHVHVLEEKAATTPGIVHFFGRRNFVFIREKSGNFEKGCLWQA